MVNAGTTGSYPATGAQSGGVGGSTVPFFYGSNWYVEKIASDTQTLDASQHEFVHNVTPGGFLRGVRLEVRSTGGVAGAATADNPANVLASTTLENIDGAPIKYPMSGYADYIANMYSRPWMGDPAKRAGEWTSGINPSLDLFLQPEIRHTAGVLANTDARALYRYRYTLSTASTITTGGTTAPTVTVNSYLETWAQPDGKDLHGNEIEAIPPGLNLQTLRRHQVLPLNPAGASNVLQLSNTGNELRMIALIVRDSNNARQDYLTDPIRLRLDNRSLGTFSPNEVFAQMNDFYPFLSNGTSTRPTGVYVWPRFYDPGNMRGQSWMQTTNATYLLIETSTLSTGTNLPGTIEVITDEVIPVGPVPMELESI